MVRFLNESLEILILIGSPWLPGTGDPARWRPRNLLNLLAATTVAGE